MAKKELKNQKDKTSFAKSFKAELKKVVWPTPKQLFNNTVAVLAIVVVTALLVFVLDFTFEAMNEYGIDKIKQVVSNSTTNTTSENVSNDENVVSNESSNSDNQAGNETNSQENTLTENQ